MSHQLNVWDLLITPFISFLHFLPCREKAHDKEFSRENLKPHRDSQIMTLSVEPIKFFYVSMRHFENLSIGLKRPSWIMFYKRERYHPSLVCLKLKHYINILNMLKVNYRDIRKTFRWFFVFSDFTLTQYFNLLFLLVTQYTCLLGM